MKSTQEHRDFVIAGIENERTAYDMQQELVGKKLTNTQANNVFATKENG